jgi:hypothetical protein
MKASRREALQTASTDDRWRLGLLGLCRFVELNPTVAPGFNEILGIAEFDASRPVLGARVGIRTEEHLFDLGHVDRLVQSGGFRSTPEKNLLSPKNKTVGIRRGRPRFVLDFACPSDRLYRRGYLFSEPWFRLQIQRL